MRNPTNALGFASLNPTYKKMVKVLFAEISHIFAQDYSSRESADSWG
jgi:hypothetical protein